MLYTFLTKNTHPHWPTLHKIPLCCIFFRSTSVGSLCLNCSNVILKEHVEEWKKKLTNLSPWSPNGFA